MIADENQDIYQKKELLSIGIRFYDENKQIIREEFVVIVELDPIDAKTIISVIDYFIEISKLDPKKFIKQFYDNCSTMPEKYNCVQSIL